MPSLISAARLLERCDFSSIVAVLDGLLSRTLVRERLTVLRIHVNQRKALFHKHYGEPAGPLNFRETPHL
jgi:hypothetical protein